MDRDGVIRKLHLFLRRLFTDYEEAGFWRRHTWDQRLLKHNISNNVVLRHLAGRYALESRFNEEPSLTFKTDGPQKRPSLRLVPDGSTFIIF